MSVRPFPSNNTLVVTQPPARVIKIVTAGPQGPPGPSGVITDSGSLATTGSNVFNGDQIINGSVSASYYEGDGSRLTNLPSTTNWNIDKEYVLRNTEQLTFSGDYILENCSLLVEGSEINVDYSPNKSFRQEGTIFIGGNLLVKDSYIENNGHISVGGEVILIGDSQIVGTGTII